MNYLEMLKTEKYIQIENNEELILDAGINGFKKYIVVRALFTVVGGNYIVDLDGNNNLFISYYAFSDKKIETIYEDVLLIGLEILPNKFYLSVGRTS